MLIYAIALLGLNLLTGFNGQLSLGHGAFFARRRIWRGDPDRQVWRAVLLRRFRLRALVCFVAGASCSASRRCGFGGLYLALATFALAVATPQLLAFKGLDFLTGGSQGLQVPEARRRCSGLHDERRSERLLRCVLAWRSCCSGSPPTCSTCRIGRALVAIRDQPDRRRNDGRRCGAVQDDLFRRSARSTPGVAGGLDAVAVGFVSPESFGLPLSLAFPRRHRHRRARLVEGADLRRALFIEFVPNYADQLTVYFGENAKALPGAVYGVLMILAMALAPTGDRRVASFAGAGRAGARRRSPDRSINERED